MTDSEYIRIVAELMGLPNDCRLCKIANTLETYELQISALKDRYNELEARINNIEGGDDWKNA